LGEQVKTTECCFYEAKSTKQEAVEAAVLRRAATMRLDWADTASEKITKINIYHRDVAQLVARLLWVSK